MDVVNLFVSSAFLCTITQPTRVTNLSATNNVQNLTHNGIVYNKLSDHFPVFSVFKSNIVKNSNNTNEFLSYRIFSDDNLNNFKYDLAEISWDLVMNTSDVTVAYSNFELIYRSLYDKHFPLINKIVCNKNNDKPYITHEIKMLIKDKNKLARKYAQYPITYGKMYKSLRNKVTNEIKKSKCKYFNDKLMECSADAGRTWKIINSVLNR